MVERRPGLWAIWIGGAVGVIAVLAVGIWWLNRPTGLNAVPDPAIVSPGGFRSHIDDHKTFTVGLNVRNTADVRLTVTDARIAAPPGLTRTAMSIVPAGKDNAGFTLAGELKPGSTVVLEPGADAVIAARFTVDCAVVAASPAPTEEQIFVTVKIDGSQREDEILVPVVGDIPWLTATATRTCLDPISTATPEPPDQPLPATTPTG